MVRVKVMGDCVGDKDYDDDDDDDDDDDGDDDDDDCFLEGFSPLRQ